MNISYLMPQGPFPVAFQFSSDKMTKGSPLLHKLKQYFEDFSWVYTDGSIRKRKPYFSPLYWFNSLFRATKTVIVTIELDNTVTEWSATLLPKRSCDLRGDRERVLSQSNWRLRVTERNSDAENDYIVFRDGQFKFLRVAVRYRAYLKRWETILLD